MNAKHMKKLHCVALVVFTLVVGGVVGYAVGHTPPARLQTATGPMIEGEVVADSTQSNLYAAMRKLWTDHVIWTREYIVAASEGSPVSESLTAALGNPTGSIATLPAVDMAVSVLGAGDAAAVRLLKNQEDIGNAIALYYGREAGDELTGLLKEHILIAVDLLNASKNNDEAAMQAEDAKWRANADEIATFLSEANPNWSKDDLLAMMNTHLDTTLDEATARLNKNYNGDVAAFDAVHDHILMMADTLSSGIIKQFPEKF